MTVRDIEHIMEQWAPRWTAWERDNVGLQMGDRDQRVRHVLVCLDVTADVVTEAVRSKADCILSHHPLLFRPPVSITTSDTLGSLILSLARHSIAVYSAHTNLDAAGGGVNTALAQALDLRSIRALAPLRNLYSKIAVFVPSSYASDVMNAMADAGAGGVGQYSHCSFQVQGQGTFKGTKGTNPFVGKPGIMETTEEVRVEMILPRTATTAVVEAMRLVHPYEEVAYDLYPLENESPQFGMGAIGTLPAAMTLNAFLRKTKKALRADNLRYAGSLRQKIQTVAVCGGSGSDLLGEARKAGADAFVTADIRYHTFHEAGDLVLIDAGHWETEQVVIPFIVNHLKKAIKERHETVSVSATKQRTNPIHCY